MIPQIIKHFTDDDLYKFTMCCAVIDNYPRAQVRYTFQDRAHTCYPAGFADELMAQVAMLEEVVITPEEIDFMKRSCPYIPFWFYDYLRGYRYDRRLVRAEQDAEGHLEVHFEGAWADTILLEVKVLAIISELYYIMTGQTDAFDLDDCYVRSYDKARRLKENGCCFSDMGTRRRASMAVHDTVVRAMATAQANHLAMRAWSATYRGALGTFLYDTYGWEIFSLNFSEDYANMFKGLRVDSGDNYEQLEKITAKYRSLGIDPRTKQVIFSNALNTDQAIELQHYARERCIPSFGIGTHFTNDFPGIKPRNIVIKLTAAKITESWTFFNPTCKLSEDHGKYTGDPEVVARFKAILHMD